MCTEFEDLERTLVFARHHYGLDRYEASTVHLQHSRKTGYSDAKHRVQSKLCPSSAESASVEHFASNPSNRSRRGQTQASKNRDPSLDVSHGRTELNYNVEFERLPPRIMLLSVRTSLAHEAAGGAISLATDYNPALGKAASKLALPNLERQAQRGLQATEYIPSCMYTNSNTPRECRCTSPQFERPEMKCTKRS